MATKGLLEKVTGDTAWGTGTENNAKVGVCPACLRNGREAVRPEQWAMREQRVMSSGEDGWGLTGQGQNLDSYSE